MVMKDCLEKNVQKKVLIEKHREYYLVLDEETGAIFLVNETSHFLYENCDGQSVESLCELLFDQCIDKDQLDKRTVYEGCTKALETLLKMELLTIKYNGDGSTMHVEGVLANNDYILNGCYIEITSNCNLRCIHCYNESGELRDQISVEAFKNVLGCYDNPKKASITLSGGEPLLHPQVWKFIDMMLESGILARNILLITNATCITDDVANMLAEKHVSVQVSLNGSRAELHDSICGKGNFERTMAGLQRLLSKHANMVIVRNMMNKQNMNDNWDMFCEKLIDMGVHKIMLAGLKKVGRANENLEKIALTPLEYQSLIDRLKESKVITGINDEYRKLAGDEAESNIRIDIPVPYSGVCPYVYQDENPVPISPRIATNGDVYLCQSFMDQRYCLGNINKDSLPHALFNENFINLVNFMTTGRFYMDDCNKCVLKYQCPRGCIGDCLANGSIHETDGGCFFRKENAIRQLLKQSEAIVAEHMQF